MVGALSLMNLDIDIMPSAAEVSFDMDQLNL
jgi:hypothetical protein